MSLPIKSLLGLLLPLLIITPMSAAQGSLSPRKPTLGERGRHQHQHMDPTISAVVFVSEYKKNNPEESAELFLRFFTPQGRKIEFIRPHLLYSREEKVFTRFWEKEIQLPLKKRQISEDFSSEWIPVLAKVARRINSMPCRHDDLVPIDRSVSAVATLLRSAGVPCTVLPGNQALHFTYDGTALVYTEKGGTRRVPSTSSK